MTNLSSQPEKPLLGCFGCFGKLLAIGFVGSLIFGYAGISIRLGHNFFGLGTAISPKLEVDTVNPGVASGNLEKMIATAVSQFHDDFSQGRFQEIYAQTDSQFRNSVSQADFLQFCQQLQRVSGKLKSTQLIDVWQPVNEQRTGSPILSRHYTSFENFLLEEQFVWLPINGKLVIVRYQVNSSNSTMPIESGKGI